MQGEAQRVSGAGHENTKSRSGRGCGLKQKKAEKWFRAGVFFALAAVMPGWQIAGVPARDWMCWGAGALEFLMPAGRRAWRERKWTALDCLAGGFFLWNISGIMAGAVLGPGSGWGSFFGMSLALLFFSASPGSSVSQRGAALSGGPAGEKDRMLLTVCAVPACAGLLWHYLGSPGYVFNLRPLLREGIPAPFLLLAASGAVEEYCVEEDRRRWTGLAVALAVYFLLFLEGDILGILLGFLEFPVSILLHRPEKEFVRRTMQMASACFFLLSNMPLLAGILPFEAGAMYSLEDGIFLQLALALAGVLFFSWWDKLPEGGEIPLHGLKKGLSWALAGTGVFLFLLLTLGEHLDGMEGGTGINLLRRFGGALREYCTGHRGSFYDILEAGGLAGGIWALWTALIAVGLAGKQFRRGKVSPWQFLVLILYLAQAVFFSQSTAAAPLYILVLGGTLGVCGKISSERERPAEGETARKVGILADQPSGQEGCGRSAMGVSGNGIKRRLDVAGSEDEKRCFDSAETGERKQNKRNKIFAGWREK